MKIYTKEEVERIMSTMFIFSGANGGQSLSKINGKTIKDKMNTVLNSNRDALGLQDAIRRFTK